MIAYNKDWLDALLTRDVARKWREKGLLSAEQWQAIQARYGSNFYSPNVFIRIGLAIFCVILLLAAVGLFALFVQPNSSIALSMFSLFWGVICLVVLESRVIGAGRHYGSGIDDMLLYCVVGSFITGFCSVLDYSTPWLVYYCIAWPILVAGSIRYLDRLLTLTAYGCSLFILMLIIKDIPGLALYLMPFAGMAFSAGAFVFARQGQGRYAWRHWHGVLTVVELLALVTFYASGNYWMVQTTGAELFQLEQVPMQGFFWIFTILVPVAYIVLGIRRKDRLLLDTGLGCVAAAVFSFRYYYHVLPLTPATVICGAILFGTAYFSIRYLHKKEGAYSYEADSETSLLQEVEEQLIEQTIVNQPGSTPDKTASFGGGQFGGGGAGGEI